MAKTNFKSVAEYIAAQPGPVRRVLKVVRDAIRQALPGADEVISYQIPAFKLNGRTIIYFAGWKEHYSIYPSGARLEQHFADELARYETSGKGTIRFPASEPVPVRLIASIAKYRASEIEVAAAKTRPAAKSTAKSKRTR
jgi:uncharacterized protein YdhG (YjbR/CyaY superfamily)